MGTLYYQKVPVQGRKDAGGDLLGRRNRKGSCPQEGIGQEDVSRDYNPYSDVQQVEMDGKTLTLKGEKGLYSLTVWTEGEYSYAASLSALVSADSWKSLVLEVTEAEGMVSAAVVFPACQEENEKELPALTAVNGAPPFQVSLELPEGWRIGEPGEKADIPVPGEFYSTLPILQGETPIRLYRLQ